MLEKVYSMQGQRAGFEAIEVSQEVYEGALEILEKMPHIQIIGFDFPLPSFTQSRFKGKSYQLGENYEGVFVSVGKVSNEYYKGKSAPDMLKISASDNNQKKVSKLEKTLGLR